MTTDLTIVARTIIDLIVRADDNGEDPAVIDALSDALLSLNIAAEHLAPARPLEADVTVSVTKVL